MIRKPFSLVYLLSSLFSTAFSLALFSALSSRFMRVAAASAGAELHTNGDSSTAKLELPPLPFAYESLDPYMSVRTLQFHHDKHHAKYIENTNALVAGTKLEGADLITILRYAHENSMDALFNNAAQAFNHEFYWNCIKPISGGGVPTGKMLELINAYFGSFTNFRAEFIASGLKVFGSGWTWLVWVPDAGLKIVNTAGAGCPLTSPGIIPLLTMDVWEHAYYLDYQNQRDKYCAVFIDRLIDWDAVANRLPPSA